MPQRGRRTLVMTVGTGDVAMLDETLFTPLGKSIATDAWARVILLPSRVTEEFARTLQERLDGAEVDVSPLPAGDENDADAAYAHFDRVLASVLQDAAPEEVVVDFTRGTKAMSAALVLAATRREVPHLRYMTGARDSRGMVMAGSEVVRETRTTAVGGHRRLDLARNLMLRGNFAAAETVLPDPEHPFAAVYPRDLIRMAGAVRTAARFYAAWDRLDYASAAGLDAGAPPTRDWSTVWPTGAMRAWVRDLEHEPHRSDHSAMAARLRRLVVDLLANGERRVRSGQHEDALVRAYRVLELIGQARLFDHRLDSAALDPDHDAVKDLQRKLEKKSDTPLTSGPGGKLQAGRLHVARILKRCNDPLAPRLFEFDKGSLLRPTLRNTSVLVHGFVARAPDDPAPLHELFGALELLVREDGGPAVAERLRVARSPAFHVG